MIGSSRANAGRSPAHLRPGAGENKIGARRTEAKPDREGDMGMNARSSPGKWLRKKAKVGVRGYPIGTVAFYGPDNTRASKAAVGILTAPDNEGDMRRWVCETGDIR